MSKRVVLNRDHMLGLLRNQQFYVACQEFAFLQETVDASWQMYVDAKSNGACKTCQGAWFKYMRGVIDATWMKIRELHTAGDTAALQRIRNFVAGQKGYDVSELVIYYRRSRTQGKIGKLVIK